MDRRTDRRTDRIPISTSRVIIPEFELDRNAPERRSDSLFKDRNGVPVHFLKIPNEIQIVFVAQISLLPLLAILKLRLSIGLLAFVTVLSSSFITPLAAHNKINTIHIKYIIIEIKKGFLYSTRVPVYV